MEPVGAQAFVAYRQKIEQGTPVRAAARQGDTWYVGGRYLDAAGGGCSVPPAVIAKIDWSNVGEIRARAWREEDGGARVRMRLLHPMDNGMIANIPAFFIETLDVTDAAGAPLAKLHLSEAIAANPTLTLLPNMPKDGDVLKIAARDNNGGSFKASVPIPAAPAPRMREGRL
jgi:sulfur-oxidizing protein SoxY